MTGHRRPPPPDRLSPWIPAIAGVTGLLFVGSVVAIAHPSQPAVGVTAARGAVEEATTVTAARESSEPLYAPQSVPTVPVQTRRAATTPRPSQTRTAASMATVAPTNATTPATATAETTTTAQAATAATTTDTPEPTLLPLPTDVLPTELPVETTSEETLP